MAIQARFYVRAIEKYATGLPGGGGGWAKPAPHTKVTLAVVSGGRAPENAEWASATPHGEIVMTIGNPAAADWFESMLGEDVAVTFEARPDTERTD